MEDRKTFGEFVKTASAELGSIVGNTPLNIAEDAYRLYSSAPVEKLASIMDQLYESIEPGYDKVALDMISANLIHDDLSKVAGLTDLMDKASENKYVKGFNGIMSHPITNALWMGSMVLPMATDMLGGIGNKIFGKKKKKHREEDYGGYNPYTPYDGYAKAASIEKDAIAVPLIAAAKATLAKEGVKGVAGKALSGLSTAGNIAYGASAIKSMFAKEPSMNAPTKADLRKKRAKDKHDFSHIQYADSRPDLDAAAQSIH